MSNRTYGRTKKNICAILFIKHPFSSQIGASSLSGSRAGSLTDLVSDQENDGSAAKVRKGLNPLADDKENLAASNPVFKVPATGLKKPEIFFTKNAAKS